MLSDVLCSEWPPMGRWHFQTHGTVFRKFHLFQKKQVSYGLQAVPKENTDELTLRIAQPTLNFTPLCMAHS